MKICQYFHPQISQIQSRVGIINEGKIVDPQLCYFTDYEREGYFNSLDRAKRKIPSKLIDILQGHDSPYDLLEEGLALHLFFEKIGHEKSFNGVDFSIPFSNELLDVPLDGISTFRDFYVHEKHVKKGFEKRKEPVPEAWYEMPVFYKGNTNSIIGPNKTLPWPSYSNKLDYELELACVLNRDGKNIKANKMSDYIFGYTIMNDVSARDIQKKEMSVRLGPSKGKDFCTVIGPHIVTADEFESKNPNLKMEAFIN
ncbi:MAG: fumarylacetoacetate hydrolase family protein, partial [Bacteriovoracaceae bacterium]